MSISRVENIMITIMFTKDPLDTIPNHNFLFMHHSKLFWQS